ncbi:YybH family protein [Leifsonia poae]|uniref:YybH family protein n=1 Tax=Leifsonia poae TaxID=110933 RepID=UPI003D66C845
MSTEPETETAAPRRADQAAIRQRIETLIRELRAKDLDRLAALYAPDVVSFDVEPPLQHVGLPAKLQNWSNAFAAFRELDYELRDLALEVGDVVAFGHGFGRLSGTLATGLVTSGMWVRATFCFRKVDDVWLIAHDHVSVPFDIRSGRGLTDLEP